MTTAAITVEVLPASFGDCLLIGCPVAGRTWRMLVDTGPDETYPALRRRLLMLPPQRGGRRHIDLFVVSHIDHDHIGGVAQLLDDAELNLDFGDIWFNAPPAAPPTRGVAEGETLAKLLGAAERSLPWNLAWSGATVATPAIGGAVELRAAGLPVVTLLSPAPEQLSDLFKVWGKELERLRRKEPDRPEPRPEPGTTRGGAPTLDELAARRTPTDHAVPNGSSIAMLLEHEGASVLLAADAHPTVLVPALRALAERRGRSGPLKIDAVKLSHHGSRANVTAELLQAVEADHFVISTNNAYFGHPDAEAVARVVTRGGQPTLWFNYDTPANRRWADPALTARYGYKTRFPERAGAGVTLELESRRTSGSA